MRRDPALRRPSIFLALLVALFAFAFARARDSAPEGDEPAAEVARTLDGRRLAGRLVGDEGSGFRFEPGDGGPPLPLSKIRQIDFARAPLAPGPEDVPPPFLLDLGRGQRISGSLSGVSQVSIELSEGPGGRPLTIDRGGTRALLQRPGEFQVLRDGFEDLDRERWRVLGTPELVADPHLEGERSLRLPAGATSLTRPLDEPVGSGRLDLAFEIDGAQVSGQRWFVDLLFEGPIGKEALQILLGWEEGGPGVVSRGGTGLATQPLDLEPGWHRLSVRFRPDRTLVSIDGDELAHGAGPGGPLVEVRLATETVGASASPEALAAHVDDLRLVRFAEPTGSVELDPSQDEVRLNQGDQIFGDLRAAGPDGLELEVNGRRVPLGWSEVSGIHFRRSATPSAWLEGPLVRVEWSPGPGTAPGPGHALDRMDGALASINDESLALETAYAGRIEIPRRQLHRLEVLGAARRLELDPHPHHLGDQFMPELDPPNPDTDRLELAFELPEVPTGPAELVLDVVQVEGEARGLRFVEELRRGDLRTNVSINDQEIDYLNRHITTRNEAPERIRLPIPGGVLRTGDNRLVFEQVGTQSEPLFRDDLGLLGIALEFGLGKPDGP